MAFPLIVIPFVIGAACGVIDSYEANRTAANEKKRFIKSAAELIRSRFSRNAQSQEELEMNVELILLENPKLSPV